MNRLFTHWSQGFGNHQWPQRKLWQFTNLNHLMLEMEWLITGKVKPNVFLDWSKKCTNPYSPGCQISALRGSNFHIQTEDSGWYYFQQLEAWTHINCDTVTVLLKSCMESWRESVWLHICPSWFLTLTSTSKFPYWLDTSFKDQCLLSHWVYKNCV